jgi:hypothetical protein
MYNTEHVKIKIHRQPALNTVFIFIGFESKVVFIVTSLLLAFRMSSDHIQFRIAAYVQLLLEPTS